MAKHIWKFVKSKKIFIVLLILYTVVFILAVRFIFHILPILLGGLLGWITAPLCRLLEKRLHLSHKRAALLHCCRRLYRFTRPSCIAFHAAHPGKRRVFCFRAILSLRSTRPRRAVVFGAHMAGIAAVDLAAQKNFSGNMGAAMPALQGTVKAILLLPAVFLTLTLIRFLRISPCCTVRICCHF